MSGRYRLGICHWSMPIDGPYACKWAKEMGFEGIQLEIGSYERGFPLSRPSVQQAYLELAAEYGIQYPSIAARVTDDYSMTQPPDTADSVIVWEAIVRSIESAESMGIPTVMIGSFLASDIRNEDDLNRTAEVLTQACDYASNRGIVIAAENLLSVDEMYRLAAQVDRQNLKLLFDTQNYPLRRGYNAAAMLEQLAPLLCDQIHVKDGPKGQISAALLGEGDSDFFRTIESLKRIDFRGWILLENYYDQLPLRLQHEEPIELIKEDKRILIEALS